MSLLLVPSSCLLPGYNKKMKTKKCILLGGDWCRSNVILIDHRPPHLPHYCRPPMAAVSSSQGGHIPPSFVALLGSLHRHPTHTSWICRGQPHRQVDVFFSTVWWGCRPQNTLMVWWCIITSRKHMRLDGHTPYQPEKSASTCIPNRLPFETVASKNAQIIWLFEDTVS